MAVSPIAGQLYGAQHYETCGSCTRRCGWHSRSRCRAACCCCSRSRFSISRASPEVPQVRGRLAALAVLPPALAFHRLPRLQHRGVAAQDRDGAAARRAAREGAVFTALFIRRRRPGFGAPGCGFLMALCTLGQFAAVVADHCGATRSTSASHIGDRFSSPHRGLACWRCCACIPMGGSISDRGDRFHLHGLLHPRIGAASGWQIQIA